MRLDHIAYRVQDRYNTAKFFKDTLGYTTGTEFQIEFDDGTTADCLALTPPEQRSSNTSKWILPQLQYDPSILDKRVSDSNSSIKAEYHAPPEIFVSDGPEGSIVGDWVSERGGIGGIHHIAYQVEDVSATMREWKTMGYAEFLSTKPLTCTGLVQVFTKPSELTGVIYELIERQGDGFCESNVKDLMTSTKELI
jgi:catechol 2,3-dioxygenase-like lactoylglutathione lyase family enzyme